MSAFSDAMKAVRDVVVMQTRIDALHKALEDHARDAKTLAATVIDLDKRVVRIETMIEMTARSGGGTPRIEG